MYIALSEPFQHSRCSQPDGDPPQNFGIILIGVVETGRIYNDQSPVKSLRKVRICRRRKEDGLQLGCTGLKLMANNGPVAIG